MDTNTPAIESDNEETDFTGSATYCPEDNKLRLYIGRVPRDEYLALRAEGWKALHKQREAGQGDFVATWSPSRRDTALRYAGMIEDEDAGPEERAADRAERFGGYSDKRLDEATGHASRYDDGPRVHGFQNRARAVRAADRHDKIAGRAVDAWDKAEYWQRRTAGVIAHALYKSSPAVRMGRIKTLEAEQRKHLASIEEYKANFKRWSAVLAESDVEKARAMALKLSNYSHGHEYKHPRPEVATPYMIEHGTSLYSLLCHEAGPITGHEAAALWLDGCIDPESEAWQETSSAAWARHYEHRLAYENAMLEAQGGRAAMLEMEVGGWIGDKQIRKVNKSPATGRVVSVTLRMSGNRWGNEAEPGEFYDRPFNIERLPVGAYRAPTDEDKAALNAKKKAEKAAAPVKAPCPLVNPTDDDAERLQAAWNERARDEHERRKSYGEFIPGKVVRMTQAQYSMRSRGSYALFETRGLCRDMWVTRRSSNLWSAEGSAYDARIGSPVCQFRHVNGGKSCGWSNNIDCVVVLTDKPQKPFPVAVWGAAASVVASSSPAVEKVAPVGVSAPPPEAVISTLGLVLDASPRVQSEFVLA